MGYAITESGSYRAVAKETILMLEETFHEDLPEWVSEKAASARVIIEQVVVEDAWRIAEVAFVTDQLLALEDGDTTALPITDRQWRDYRIKVRAWKDGAEYFPDQAYRPVRPT